MRPSLPTVWRPYFFISIASLFPGSSPISWRAACRDGVRMRPGDIVLTVTPLPASAFDRPTVRLINAALADAKGCGNVDGVSADALATWMTRPQRSEEHTSELQSLMRIS